jgi:hypothetical protein
LASVQQSQPLLRNAGAADASAIAVPEVPEARGGASKESFSVFRFVPFCSIPAAGRFTVAANLLFCWVGLRPLPSRVQPSNFFSGCDKMRHFATSGRAPTWRRNGSYPSDIAVRLETEADPAEIWVWVRSVGGAAADRPDGRVSVGRLPLREGRPFVERKATIKHN